MQGVVLMQFAIHSYIQLKNLGVMKQFFPQMQLEELEGNHWSECTH